MANNSLSGFLPASKLLLAVFRDTLMIFLGPLLPTTFACFPSHMPRCMNLRHRAEAVCLWQQLLQRMRLSTLTSAQISCPGRCHQCGPQRSCASSACMTIPFLASFAAFSAADAYATLPVLHPDLCYDDVESVGYIELSCCCRHHPWGAGNATGPHCHGSVFKPVQWNPGRFCLPDGGWQERPQQRHALCQLCQ